MGHEVAALAATADGFDEFDLDGPAERGRENRLVRRARAFAVEIVRPRGVAARRGAEATVLLGA